MEDSFEDEPVDDDLFSTSTKTNLAQSDVASTSGISRSADLSNQRDTFDERREFIARLCGKHPVAKSTPTRDVLAPLVELVQNKMHLDDLTDIVAGWREAKRAIDPQTSGAIISRCVTLKHPEVALALLANRPRYGVDLTSLSSARSLLHSLCERAQEASLADPESDDFASVTSSPFNDVVLLAALYPQYRLPEAFEDPITTGILLSLTKSSQSEEAQRLQQDLLDISKSRQGESTVRVEASKEERSWAENGVKELPYTVEFS